MMLENEVKNKVFVYKLMISQLHHDGYNALALLMEQMLLASKKVQPSDCLTQLLNVCKAVSFADKELILDEESVVMSEEDKDLQSPTKSPDKQTSSLSASSSPAASEKMNCKNESHSPTTTTTCIPIFSAASLLEPPLLPPPTMKDPLAETIANTHTLSQIFDPHKDALSQMMTKTEALFSSKPTTPIVPAPSLLLPATSPLLSTSTPTLPTPTPLLPTSTPLRSLSTPILHSTNRFNPTILTHPYSFPLGRSGSLPFFPNLHLKSPDPIKVELEKEVVLDAGHLLGGRLQDVVRAFTASSSTFPLPSSICNNWPNNLLSQVHQTGSGRQHKMKHCPVCNKVLVASSLYLHMKIHTGEKNYICEFCCKRFLLKHHLHSHLKICQSRTLVLNKTETSQA